MASGFLPDMDPGERPRFNLDAIECLQLPARARRAEMREEVEKGLRSYKSYADAAGYGDEVESTPMTRALWLPAGKTPIPANDDDAEALGVGPEEEETDDAVPTGGGGSPDAIAGVAPAADPNPDAPLFDTATPAGAPAGGTPPTAAGTPTTPRLAAPTETKAKPQPAPPAHWTLIEPEDTETAAVAALHAALAALGEKWIERAGARVKSPKTRKGTRHFTPEYVNDTRVGTKALDAAYAADEEGAADDADQQTRPLVEAAALAAAAAWLAASTGAAVTVATLPAALAAKALASAGAVMPALIDGAAWQARRIGRVVSDTDAAGGTVQDVLGALVATAEDIARWASNAAMDAAGAATEVGYQAAAEHRVAAPAEPLPKLNADDSDTPDGRPPLPEVAVQRQWISRHDGDVRPTHVKAHGQLRDVDQAFTVGGHLLRFPKDPLAPPGETRNCRCRSQWRQKATGRFLPVEYNPAVAAS